MAQYMCISLPKLPDPHCYIISLDSDCMGGGIVFTTSKDSCSAVVVVIACVHITQSRCTGNHRAILTDAGCTDIREYRYFKNETRGLDYEGMMDDLKVNRKISTFTIM